MSIVIYKAQGKDWQMTRIASSKRVFWTAINNPSLFQSEESAQAFAFRCLTFARDNLGWRDAIWDVIDVEDFDLHLNEKR